MSDPNALYLGIAGLVLNSVGLAFVAVQVVLARAQLRHMQRAAQTEAARLKRQATIDFYMGAAEQLRQWRSSLPDDWDSDGVANLTKRLYGDTRSDDEMGTVATYLAFFEALAAAANVGVYDVELLDAIAGSRIINIAHNYTDFFDRRRKEVGTRSAYVYLERLAEELRDLRSKSPSSYAVPTLEHETDSGGRERQVSGGGGDDGTGPASAVSIDKSVQFRDHDETQ